LVPKKQGAEVRLGELFKGLEKKQGFASIGCTDATNTKYDTIRSLGFDDPKATAYRFEQLADYKDIVEVTDCGWHYGQYKEA
jgi:hypothetical protein